MEDRFKFRFWHKPTNKMLDCYGFNEHCTFANTLDGIGTEYNPCATKDCELMQCTGLKDKNGKLIFEGDILELYVSTKKAYRYQVKYEIGSFMLVSDDEIFDFRNKWNDNVYPLSQLYFEYENEEDCIWECEVIGNIYENKELLNEI